MPALVALLALKSGKSKEKSEQFIKDFSKLLFDTLASGEEVKIKSLGSFRVMKVDERKSVNVSNGEEIIIPEHKRIVFVPAKDIAEVINSPFSIFESVELNPDVEQQILTDDVQNLSVNEDEPSALPTESDTLLTQNVIEEVGGAAPNDRDVETVSSESEPVVEELTERSKRGGLKFFWGLICGLLLALLIVGIGYLFFFKDMVRENPDLQSDFKTVVTPDSVPDTKLTDTAADSVELTEETALSEKIASGDEELKVTKKDTSAESSKGEEAAKVATRPSDEVVKDVIGPQNYLTTMAQRHYGNFNLWPIIYEENKKMLGHPDRIKPGTEVVIPPLSKYGVDPNNPSDIKKAKQKGVEIYSRYK